MDSWGVLKTLGVVEHPPYGGGVKFHGQTDTKSLQPQRDILLKTIQLATLWVVAAQVAMKP